MGNWNISIRGVGVHHNRNLKTDANRMAADFVQNLREAGHSIISATISLGDEDIGTGANYHDGRDDKPSGE